MARHNENYLMGIVSKVKTIKDDSTGIYIQGSFELTITSPETAKTESIASPQLLSRKPSMIAEIAKLQDGDIVFVRGTFTTRNVVKRSFCPECNAENLNEGSSSFITPIAIYKLKNIDQKQEFIEKHKAFANNVSMIGHLTKDPETYDYAKMTLTQYSLSVKRKYIVEGTDSSHRYDFPRIRSVGKIAENDANMKENDAIHLKGRLQTRSYDKKLVCSSCKTNYTKPDISMEVVTSQVDYLSDNSEDDKFIPRQNEVFLFGRVRGVSSQNTITGMLVETIRGHRNVGSNIRSLIYDCPWVMTQDETISEEINLCKENDIVLVKGHVILNEVKRSVNCPCCGETNTEDSIFVCVMPIDIIRLETDLLSDEAIDILKENCEISNNVNVIGQLIDNPESIIKPHFAITDYEISSVVKSKDGGLLLENAKIRSYAAMAKSDSGALHKDSVVHVNGVLQTKRSEEEIKCEFCKKNFMFKQSYFEIVPYGVEYLYNYRSKAEAELHQARMMENKTIENKDIIIQQGSSDDYTEFLY